MYKVYEFNKFSYGKHKLSVLYFKCDSKFFKTEKETGSWKINIYMIKIRKLNENGLASFGLKKNNCST